MPAHAFKAGSNSILPSTSHGAGLPASAAKLNELGPHGDGLVVCHELEVQAMALQQSTQVGRGWGIASIQNAQEALLELLPSARRAIHEPRAPNCHRNDKLS